VRLPRRLPRAIALELLLTGAPLTAERAEHLGLVNRVVPDGSVLTAAHELARTVAANAPLAVAAAKALVVDSGDWPEDELFTRQAAYTEPVFASADAREGARAFAERRAPRWTGS
jgi:enoyl-CoA hydratase/carnithine racemase